MKNKIDCLFILCLVFCLINIVWYGLIIVNILPRYYKVMRSRVMLERFFSNLKNPNLKISSKDIFLIDRKRNIEGIIEKKYFTNYNVKFMNIKNIMKYIKNGKYQKDKIFYKTGRYEKRRQKDYENSFYKERNIILPKRNFLHSTKVKESILLKNEDKIFSHTAINDFLSLDDKRVAFVSYFLTTKKLIKSIITGEWEKTKFIKTSSQGIEQRIYTVPYGVVVESEKEVDFILNNLKKINDHGLEVERNVLENSKKLSEILKDENSQVILLNRVNEIATFNRSNFNYKEIQSKGQLRERAIKLIEEKQNEG